MHSDESGHAKQEAGAASETGEASEPNGVLETVGDLQAHSTLPVGWRSHPRFADTLIARSFSDS